VAQHYFVICIESTQANKYLVSLVTSSLFLEVVITVLGENAIHVSPFYILRNYLPDNNEKKIGLHI
jgi:hypothetical protein